MGNSNNNNIKIFSTDEQTSNNGKPVMMEHDTLITPAYWISDVPFPSEESIDTRLGQIFSKGYEGYCDKTTTHFGWMDLILLKELVNKNNASRIVLQNLDTLGKVGKINGCVQLCIAYRYKHYTIHYIPKEGLSNCRPIYSQFLISGWEFDEDEAEELPYACQSYMRALLKATHVKEVIYVATKFTATAYFDENGIVRFDENPN